MFTAITKLVLKTKKEQQLRIQQQQTNDTLKLRSGSRDGRRKKCCWHDFCSLFYCYFVCNNFTCCLAIFILGMYQVLNPSPASPKTSQIWPNPALVKILALYILGISSFKWFNGLMHFQWQQSHKHLTGKYIYYSHAVYKLVWPGEHWCWNTWKWQLYQ